jgi:hypothetical protein
MRNFRNFLKENNAPTLNGDIILPGNWTDLSTLAELYPGYTPGCKINGNLDFNGCNELTSLEGAPSEVDGIFFCNDCKSLTSLKGAPSIVKNAFTSNCTSLTSLKGAPLTIKNGWKCSRCTSLTSLQGIGKEYCLSAKIINLSGCEKLSSQMLGLMLVKNLQEIRFDVNKDLESIFNNHLSGNKDMMDCKEDLMNAGYKEYAKL